MHALFVMVHICGLPTPPHGRWHGINTHLRVDVVIQCIDDVRLQAWLRNTGVITKLKHHVGANNEGIGDFSVGRSCYYKKNNN